VSSRGAGLVILGGFLVAGLGALGVALGDPPHLDFGGLDPWLVVYAIGLLAAFGAMPFPLHEHFATRTTDRDKRWELALTAWGGIALAALAAFVILGIAGGFSAASASGSLAIVGIAECALVIGGLVTLIAST
jgi:hypothetical protein